MRMNVRDKELLDPFISKLRVATDTRFELLTGLIEQMTFCTQQLTQRADRVRGYLNSDRARTYQPSASLYWTWRSHANKEKVSPIEVHLYLDFRPEGGTVKQYSLRERSRRTELLTPILGIRAARHFTKDLDSFFTLADQAVRWINALPGESLLILNKPGARSGLDQWIDAVGGLTEKASLRTISVVESFLNLDSELNDLVFEFNAARQPVRFHSIICRRDCSKLDVLSPAEPRFRVIVHFNRRTGRRTSKDVQAYKQDLAKKRIVEKLDKLLGRSPLLEEVEHAMTRQRKRLPTPWLTEDLISHCKLGRHSSEIFKHHKKILIGISDWKEKRQLIQKLLDKK